MTIMRIIVAALLAVVATGASLSGGFAADKPVATLRSSPPPGPVPGPGPHPPLDVCRHASPDLPPVLKCVEEVQYRRCGCDNACQIQYGRPPNNTDPHWDAKPLSRCTDACAATEVRERAACRR